jgi:hypothetical protein
MPGFPRAGGSAARSGGAEPGAVDANAIRAYVIARANADQRAAIIPAN